MLAKAKDVIVEEAIALSSANSIINSQNFAQLARSLQRFAALLSSICMCVGILHVKHLHVSGIASAVHCLRLLHASLTALMPA
jgi:hypothetical protein